MLPFIPVVLGGVALAATGYGLGRLLHDDIFREDLEDKISQYADSVDEWFAKQKTGLDTHLAKNEVLGTPALALF